MREKVRIEVKDLTVSYYGVKAVEEVSFKLPFNQIVGIIGPNGAGKSTLIKAVMGLIPREKGKIKINGESAGNGCGRKIAKEIAYVPQHREIDHNFPLSVKDVVMMGRYPYIPLLKKPSAKDHEIVKDSLEKVDLLEVINKQIGELSGGQTQRVFLARALAQKANLLILDEPFAGIDMGSEWIIASLLESLKNKGKTILMVHHDLNKAGSLFDRILLLNKRLVKYGKSEEVFKPHYIEKAYEGKVVVMNSDLKDQKTLS